MKSHQKHVVACSHCKRLFETILDTALCPTCKELDEKVFKKVRDYVRLKKAAGIYEVSEACDVSTKKILYWVREERLCFHEESEVAVPCLNCGIRIQMGRYCEPCKKKMANNLKSMYVVQNDSDDDKLQSRAVNKMHYLNKHR